MPPVHNTEPNAALRLEDGSFAPAHMLPDARLERAGRQSKVERQVGAGVSCMGWMGGVGTAASAALAARVQVGVPGLQARSNSPAREPACPCCWKRSLPGA